MNGPEKGHSEHGVETQSLSLEIGPRPEGWWSGRWPGLLVVGVALALRLAGLWHGLPFVYTADNETAFVEPAMRILLQRDPNPHWFGHPGSTVIYGQALLIAMLYYGSLILGRVSSFPEFFAAFRADPTLVYIVLRVANALVGTATVALVWVIGRSLFGNRAALAAAVLLSVAPLHLKWSQVARTDVPVTFLALASVAAALMVLRSGRQRWYLLGGATAGLAIATKYPGGVVVIALVVAHLAHALPERPTATRALRAILSHRLWLGLAMLPLALVVAAPFVVLDWRQAVLDIMTESRPTHLGAERLPGLANYLWYLQVGLPLGLGTLAALAAGGGLLGSLRARWREQLVLLTFPALFLVVLGNANLRWSHWSIPLLPFGALWAGFLYGRATGWLERILLRWAPAGRGDRPAIFTALPAVLLLGLLAAEPLATAALHDYRQMQTDTRTLAKQWVEENLPSGTSVAVEAYGGFIARPGLRVMTRVTLSDLTLEEYGTQAYSYLVVSDWMWQRYLAQPARYPHQVAFYQMLFERAPLLVEFNPRLDSWLGSRAGPTIRVYRTP